METVQQDAISLKQIFKDNWDKFLSKHYTLVTAYMAYNVWKIMNCREPEGLGYITYSCPDHPQEICQIPKSCKSRFCSICAKVQIDNWVAEMNSLFPNCSYFHVTFTVPSQFRILLFEKRSLLNAVFSACTETLQSFCKERGFLPAITAVLHTLKTIEFIRKLIRHIPPHYFNVIRHYGILANRVKNAYQKLTEKLLGAAPDVEKAKTWRERQELFHGKDPLRCRICNKIMKFSSAYSPNSLSSIKAKMDIDFS